MGSECMLWLLLRVLCLLLHSQERQRGGGEDLPSPAVAEGVDDRLVLLDGGQQPWGGFRVRRCMGGELGLALGSRVVVVWCGSVVSPVKV